MYQETINSLASVCGELRATLARLEHLGLITTDPADEAACCGLPRDEDGRCTHRPGHPVWVRVGEWVAGGEV
jgi:hypothetical protein